MSEILHQQIGVYPCDSVHIFRFFARSIVALWCYDLGGNSRESQPARLLAVNSSISLGFNQTEQGDESPPTVTALAIESQSVNTSQGSATVVASLSFTDDMSGLN